jgi:hypothetical protein
MKEDEMGRHMACMAEIRNVHKLLVLASQRKKVCETICKNGNTM